MEAEVITSLLPDLVTAISDCVQPVSDQCLAKGLIPESVYKRVLESGGTSEDKARTLILAVKKSTETDNACFESFLKILDQQLPYGVKDSLLSTIKKKFNDKAAGVCMSLVSVGKDSQVALKQRRADSLFGFEDAIKQHERACTEREFLEDNLKSIAEENQKLKRELASLLSKIHDRSMNESNIASTKGRISASEDEMSELRGRMAELNSIIDEQAMKIKRGRDRLEAGFVSLMDQLAMQKSTQTNHVALESRCMELELKQKLKDMEQELLLAQEECAKEKERYTSIVKEKDNELELAQMNIWQTEEMKQRLELSIRDNEVDLRVKDVEVKRLRVELQQAQTSIRANIANWFRRKLLRQRPSDSESPVNEVTRVNGDDCDIVSKDFEESINIKG